MTVLDHGKINKAMLRIVESMKCIRAPVLPRFSSCLFLWWLMSFLHAATYKKDELCYLTTTSTTTILIYYSWLQIAREYTLLIIILYYYDLQLTYKELTYDWSGVLLFVIFGLVWGVLRENTTSLVSLSSIIVMLFFLVVVFICHP